MLVFKEDVDLVEAGVGGQVADGTGSVPVVLAVHVRLRRTFDRHRQSACGVVVASVPRKHQHSTT